MSLIYFHRHTHFSAPDRHLSTHPSLPSLPLFSPIPLDGSQGGVTAKMTVARALARDNESQKILSRIRPIRERMSGIAFGSLCEWGIPPGQMGLKILLSFLTTQSHSNFLLWIYNQAEMQVYPPAWQQQGLDLSRLFFINLGENQKIQSKKKSVIEAIKPVFLENVFPIIILDDIYLTRSDMAFLHAQAKRLHKIIFVVYPKLLSHKVGNVWAKWRLNAWLDLKKEYFHFEALKGPKTFHLQLPSHQYENTPPLS
ncbi:MAG: hypothetical protein AB7T49_00885 [Oligoflexales bacterium]